MCEEFESHQDRSEQPGVLVGQSIVLGEIKAEVPLENDIPSHHQIPWQQHMEQIESFSQESKKSEVCMDAGFVKLLKWDCIS